jgi:cytoskeletal protein CcmA (bactofilin family)
MSSGLAALLALALLPVAARPAQEFGELLVKKGILHGDQYLAGGTVDVHGTVEGDLSMAGVQAGLDGRVTGDVAAVGVLVHVGGIVGDDVRALGGKVIVEGWVGDGLLAAGGEVLLTRGTRVGGTAMLAGRRVTVLGDVEGDLLAVGEVVELAGDVRGSTSIRSDEVIVGPKAKLLGDLVVRGSKPPRIAPGAFVGGRVVVEEPGPIGLLARLRGIVGAAAMQVGLLLVAWAWMALAPRLSRESVVLEWRGFPAVAGIGLAVAFGLPIVAGLLAITVVGIPVAVGTAAVWALLMLAGYSSTAVCLGDWLASRGRGGVPDASLGRRLLRTFLALLLLRAAAAVPWVGAAVTVGAVVVGAGAVARAAQEAHQRGRISRGPPGPAAA